MGSISEAYTGSIFGAQTGSICGGLFGLEFKECKSTCRNHQRERTEVLR